MSWQEVPRHCLYELLAVAAPGLGVSTAKEPSPPLASVSSVLRRKPRKPVLAQTVWVSPKLSRALKWSAWSPSSP